MMERIGSVAVPTDHGLAAGMTPSEFYRDEAGRCLRRAEASRRPERARKWHDLADEYLRLALMMEGASEAPPPAAMGAAVQQETQQPQSQLRRTRK
jgi:hypothetical protein